MVLKASQNLEKIQSDNKIKKHFATILAFNVKILPEAAILAQEKGVTIFAEEVIYHLTDKYNKHVEQCEINDKASYGRGANFPVILNTVAVFNRKKPLVLGVEVERGQLRKGQVLCIHPKKKVENKQSKKWELIMLGEILSIQHEQKELEGPLRKGSGSVAIKLNSPNNITAGRHFTEEDTIVSFQNRLSIDQLKAWYMDEMLKDDWYLMRDFKGEFEII